jgi:hypothetical protein
MKSIKITIIGEIRQEVISGEVIGFCPLGIMMKILKSIF